MGDDNVGASFYQSPRSNEVMEGGVLVRRWETLALRLVQLGKICGLEMTKPRQLTILIGSMAIIVPLQVGTNQETIVTIAAI